MRYTFAVDFETAPERVDSLTAAAIAELGRLRVDGPTDRDFEKVRAARARDFDGEVESNSYWANAVAWHIRMGWPLGTIGNHDGDQEVFLRPALRAACQKYLQTSEYVQVTMLPRGSAKLATGSASTPP
jgi:zinc protease